MTNWKKLLLPAGLGVVAAVLNWMAISRGVTPQTFVRVVRDMQRGETVAREDVEPIELRGDLANLPATASLYKDVETVLGRPLTRDLKRGDLVLWQDTEPREETLWIPVSLASIDDVPAQVRAGEEVQFRLEPLPASEAPTMRRIAATPEEEMIGPFRVQAVDGDTILITAVFLTDSHQLDRPSQRLLAALTGAARERVAAVEVRSIARPAT